jgi:hypothetical protein
LADITIGRYEVKLVPARFEKLGKNLKIVKELETVVVADTTHPRRRIVILQRDDSNYSFAEQYFFASRYEGEIIKEGWQTLQPSGIYRTAAIAETEGRAAFARWPKPASER